MSVGSANEMGKISDCKRYSSEYCALNLGFGVLFIPRSWPSTSFVAMGQSQPVPSEISVFRCQKLPAGDSH